MYKEYASKQFVEEYLKSQNFASEKDWLENDEESSSYIENRPGGYQDEEGNSVRFDKQYMPESNVYFTEGGTNVPDIPEGGGGVNPGGGSSTVVDAMKKTTYDPNGYNTDIFAYVNRHVPITSITPTDENIKIWIDPADNSGSIITPAPQATLSSVIIETNKGQHQKFWRGTQAEYDAISEKDEATMYIIIDKRDNDTDNEETAFQIQGDWNQNDSEAVDYIKNRTHWIGKEITPILNNDEIISNSNWYLSGSLNQTGEGNPWSEMFTSSLDLSPTYIVIYDGKKYTLNTWQQIADAYGWTQTAIGDSRLTTTPQVDSNGEFIYGEDGNPVWVVDTSHPSDVPFLILCYREDDGGGMGWNEYGTIIHADGNPGAHIISIGYESENEVYHKLDERFLPDGIATKQYVDDLILTAMAAYYKVV